MSWELWLSRDPMCPTGTANLLIYFRMPLVRWHLTHRETLSPYTRCRCLQVRCRCVHVCNIFIVIISSCPPGGHAKLLVMLCVSPTQRFISESLQSLGFGTRVRQVQKAPPRRRNNTLKVKWQERKISAFEAALASRLFNKVGCLTKYTSVIRYPALTVTVTYCCSHF